MERKSWVLQTFFKKDSFTIREFFSLMVTLPLTFSGNKFGPCATENWIRDWKKQKAILTHSWN